MDRISAGEPMERVTHEQIDSYIRVFKELTYPKEQWDMAEKDGVVVMLRRCSLHIHSLSSELEKAKADVSKLNKCCDETINDLRDRLCAVEEASSIKGTMLHESEEKIKMLESETATLKRQRDELKDGMETLANAALMSLGSGE
jgi:uncharacterized protein YhaN